MRQPASQPAPQGEERRRNTVNDACRRIQERAPDLAAYAARCWAEDFACAVVGGFDLFAAGSAVVQDFKYTTDANLFERTMISLFCRT